MKLAASSDPGKEVGWIDKLHRSKRQEIALGYVKRGFNSANTRLDAFAAGNSEPKPVGAIRVEVVPLPFLSEAVQMSVCQSRQNGRRAA